MNICIIDYGLGNSGSIQNMLKRIGYSSVISSRQEDIDSADLLFLPGVGSFDDGVTNLERLNLIPILEKKVLVEKTPIIGICLGMQLLLSRSEEGNKAGLGWIKGECKKFKFHNNPDRLRVPHMGWNITSPSLNSNNLFDLDFSELRFYYVHSYYAALEDKANELCTAFYGFTFSSGIQKDNIIGLQFHPEKSHKFGMALLKNLVNQLVSVKS